MLLPATGSWMQYCQQSVNPLEAPGLESGECLKHMLIQFAFRCMSIINLFNSKPCDRSPDADATLQFPAPGISKHDAGNSFLGEDNMTHDGLGSSG